MEFAEAWISSFKLKVRNALFVDISLIFAVFFLVVFKASNNEF